ncbi:CRE-PSTK-1 protein [Caenorhabditis remanei]|uniref:CRE-PSTK-1 protein n=1 Tax=Caenorhabditis remanei TaxID=31234 RepID=E3N321_CAERE|nr:CRE-PSTK-1 protein [Caenorhabditis remanei]
MAILLLLMGLPASGKSSLRLRLQTAHSELIESTSFDEFRMTMMQTCSTANARENRKEFQRDVESRIISKSPADKIWIIEDIFYLKSMRRPFSRISRRRHLKYGVVNLKVSPFEAIRRNSGRNSDEKQREETIWRVFEEMEPPEDSTEISIDLEQEEAGLIGLEGVLERLGIRMDERKDSKELEMEKNPPTPSTSSTVPSPLEILDVKTRRLVSQLIQNDRFLDGRKLSVARKMLISSSDLNELSCVELKEKLLDLYDKL